MMRKTPIFKYLYIKLKENLNDYFNTSYTSPELLWQTWVLVSQDPRSSSQPFTEDTRSHGQMCCLNSEYIQENLCVSIAESLTSHPSSIETGSCSSDEKTSWSVWKYKRAVLRHSQEPLPWSSSAVEVYVLCGYLSIQVVFMVSSLM